MKQIIQNFGESDLHLNFPFEVIEKEKGPSDNELIQIEPYGLTVGADMIRPVLIFKAINSDLTMPVPINPLEAGVTLTQSNKSIAPVTPHKATQALLAALGVRIDKCVFIEIKGHHQWVNLYLSGNALVRTVKVRADEAMSLCLHLEVPIFTLKELALKSKVITAELEGMKKDPLLTQQMSNAFLGKKHPYMN